MIDLAVNVKYPPRQVCAASRLYAVPSSDSRYQQFSGDPPRKQANFISAKHLRLLFADRFQSQRQKKQFQEDKNPAEFALKQPQYQHRRDSFPRTTHLMASGKQGGQVADPIHLPIPPGQKFPVRKGFTGLDFSPNSTNP